MGLDEVKVLVLIRHAKSSWDTDGADIDRPLSGRGRRDATAIGALLRTEAVRPDLVLCSPATRTQQTWHLAAEAGVSATEVRFEPGIYHAWVPELVSLVRAAPETVRTLALVGHAPGIPDLVSHLARRDPGSDLWSRLDRKFPTAGIARLGVSGSWSDLGKGGAELIAFDVARASA